MEYRIEQLDKKILVGIRQEMSYIENMTKNLWRTFMPRRNDISNRVDSHYYSMQIYSGVFDYNDLDPAANFLKWAAVEVSSTEDKPEGMEFYRLTGGLYAVFTHIGPAYEFKKTMVYIFDKWLPTSGYRIDNREHFELLEKDYNPLDENAREEVWMPIVKL